ncbi:MAG: KTSC domain-containing protein [bacterium]|nr:KTSC domain-containing protein [bacterium]
MNRIPVSSSNIRSIGYDPQSAVLEVEFTSGDVYQYFDVPERLYDGLLQAASHGQFLDINIIKYGYRYQKRS